MDIKLKYINLSNDPGRFHVVMFQPNLASCGPKTCVAWKVIRNCGYGWYHPVVFSTQLCVAIEDAWGNHFPKLKGQAGDIFSAHQTAAGIAFVRSGSNAPERDLHIRNDLPRGSLVAHVFRGDRLLGSQQALAPGQMASFRFDSVLRIGVLAAHVSEGDLMTVTPEEDVNSRLYVEGIRAADIIMTGGGPGFQSQPFRFHLENIKP